MQRDCFYTEFFLNGEFLFYKMQKTVDPWKSCMPKLNNSGRPHKPHSLGLTFITSAGVSAALAAGGITATFSATPVGELGLSLAGDVTGCVNTTGVMTFTLVGIAGSSSSSSRRSGSS